MPFATFTRVREVSSEDNVHLAENLIKDQPNKKWKTKKAGEKSAYVVLEMADNYQITGIDIGNEHSAFVEVLVGKLAGAPGDFTEILITSSFMTPPESKASINTNRVRCFNRDALVPNIAEDKWSLVKILCTQPFNKHVQYGLSFIKVHVNDDMKNSLVTQKNLDVPADHLNKTTKVIGDLKFREDSPDSESETSFGLFNRWKKLKHNNEETTAASIRMNAKNLKILTPGRISDEKSLESSPSLKKDVIALDRNREKLLFGDETDDDMHATNPEKLKRLSAQIEMDKKRRRMEIEKEINKKPKKSIDSSAPNSVDNVPTKPRDTKSIESNSSDNLKPFEGLRKQLSSSAENTIKSIKPAQKYRPFNQLLKGVVLVISGIQNPDRAELRNKAMALGAKYKSDWDNTCTHLICAFKNTPKYNQVKGKGKIVTRSWIEKCFSSKKYLPWRRFALDSTEVSKPESDEEIIDDSLNSEITETNNRSDFHNNNTMALLSSNSKETEERNKTLRLYDNDDRSFENSKEGDNKSSSSESDTDDEIKRIQKTVKDAKLSATSKTVDIYEASTEEEDYITEKFPSKS